MKIVEVLCCYSRRLQECLVSLLVKLADLAHGKRPSAKAIQETSNAVVLLNRNIGQVQAVETASTPIAASLKESLLDRYQSELAVWEVWLKCCMFEMPNRRKQYEYDAEFLLRNSRISRATSKIQATIVQLQNRLDSESSEEQARMNENGDRIKALGRLNMDAHVGLCVSGLGYLFLVASVVVPRDRD